MVARILHRDLGLPRFISLPGDHDRVSALLDPHHLQWSGAQEDRIEGGLRTLWLGGNIRGASIR